jgi:hypothetical protein
MAVNLSDFGNKNNCDENEVCHGYTLTEALRLVQNSPHEMCKDSLKNGQIKIKLKH